MSATDTEPRITYRDMRTNLEKVTDEYLKERVLNGIKLLEREYGEDWVNHIDPRTLILSNSSSCVLGQLFDPKKEHTKGKLEELGRDDMLEDWEDCWATDDGYSIGLNVLGEDAQDHGFLDSRGASFLQLTNTWRTAFGYPEVDEEPPDPN